MSDSATTPDRFSENEPFCQAVVAVAARAGWIETALILYPGVVLVNIWWRYFAAYGAHGLSDFFMVGNGPALLWVLVIMALLWTDRLLRLLGN